MADVKRLNYFNTQYLEQEDFKDEQKYHLEMRRLHNKRFHTPGIAYGLTVTRTGAQSISVSPGMALDNEGREMVQLDAFSINLPTNSSDYPAGSTIYVTIAYEEKPTDSQPKDVPNPRGFTRITEKPKIQALAVPPNTAPPTDGSVVPLAKFTLEGSNVPTEDKFDNSVRVAVGAVLADKSVSIKKLKTTLVPGSDSLTLAAGGRATLRAFEAPLSSASSAFLVVYAYSITPGANFRWEQGYSTEGTQPNLRVVQTVTFSHSGGTPIEVKYKIYVVLES